LVLVRRRNAFFEELVRNLKALNVPVAGVDRMVLSDQLAVMDLIALGQVMLLPEDDLALACVLKGPLVGLSEEQLFKLAYGRSGSLWGALRGQGLAADAPPAFAAAWKHLSQLLAQADFMPPYEFYAEVLGRQGGRCKLLARLGLEAADAIDEFLNQALLYEQERVPSLQGFLHWLESGGHEVKRDMEHGNDAVRVMTVHGAKGLQAPIVILPDTMQTPSSHGGLLWLERHGGLPLWGLKSDYDGPVAAAARGDAKKAQEQEYRRLLYVAMTRAEDRLYLCGWNTQRSAAEGCWYNLAARGLAKASAAEALQFDFSGSLAEGWQGDGWRLASKAAGEPQEEVVASEDVMPPPEPLPLWASLPGPEEPKPPRPLMPSRPSGPEPALRSPLGAQEGPRFRRGRLIHKLLQHLPEVPSHKRKTAAQRLIRAELRQGDGLDGEEIIAETLAVLDHPEFADIFGPGSQAEVPIIGLLEEGAAPQVIAGQVDRLVLGARNLRIVDFKTNRPVPNDETEVPAVYLRQLAAYRAVLSKIYPDKTIDCLLLWTDAPRLMQISDAMIAQY
jgi:ATP-dependent helicase/nuclease subunit A